MPQADFVYDLAANDAAGLPLSVAIFADRPALREEIRADAAAAGLRIGEAGPLAGLLEDIVRPLGELVLLDCPAVPAATIAALARLDIRARNSGAQLIVSTSLESLDAVFGCLDQADVQILVAPSRGERVVALGRALAKLPGMRVRDLSDDDRLTLLRLTEQVGQIAERLDRLSSRHSEETKAFRFESPRDAFHPEVGDERRLMRMPRPPMPDPRLVRQIIQQRQLRSRFFDGELFADPAWDILLDLTAARAEHTRVSVTSLCIASGVPPTTALRWIAQMTDAGLLERVEDETDRRRAFIALSDKAADAMARYFVEVGKDARHLV